MSHHRSAGISVAGLVFVGSLVVLIVCSVLLFFDPSGWFKAAEEKQPLLVYCAAGLKTPMAAVAKEYEREYHVPVQIQYGGSQTLLANVEVAERGDLYVPADDSYIALAREKKLSDEVLPLAKMTAVLVVKKGNPKGLKSLDELLKSELRVSLANPDAAAVGKLVRDTLQKAGQWDAFQKRVVVQKPTVNDVATDVQVGAADAAVIWDSLLGQFPDLEAIPAPVLAKTTAAVSASVLKSSRQPTVALHFARYLAARDKGLVQFEKNGFTVVKGDAWAETPELRFLSGAMLRPAIDETITAFEKREGVKVTRVYNGCGILVAQMRTDDKPPDAYFACDEAFMKQVNELFEEPIAVSGNQLVILVPKGNPNKIRGLKDLGKPDLRIGVGHEKQCALGVITQTTLKQEGFESQVMKNVKVQTPTGDMLVNQMRTGSLDAVIVYVSNAADAKDELEAIKVDVPCALATQPVAVGKTSDHKYLTERLLAALRTKESRQRFEALGFQWKTGGEKK
jgi:molybdenum ABC transporter molybdate-binding protein